MDYQPTSGDRVRYWRRRKKLTLIELARKTGISKSALSRIENDKQALRSQEMETLVAVLEITVGRFYGGEVKTTGEARVS